AVYLEPDGSMVVSLDAAATLGVNQIDYERWDLIRYKRSGGSGCGNWILDETAAPGGRAEVFDGNDLMDEAMNVVGATLSGDQIIMAINIQGHLQQSPTHNPYNPTVGEVATWDINTEQFSLTTTFASFPTTGTGGAYAQINSVAAPPVGCSALGSPNEGDTIVDMCGVTWVTEAQMRRFRMEWISMDGAFLYKVYRGGREDLCDGGITFSVVQQSTQTYYIENDDPAPVDAYYYLVTALTAQGEQPPGCANPAGCSGCCPRPLPPYPTTTPCP
ncbi:MAG: hypothetical protein GY716_12915, partial [bacterium]|nr:hypothetical protein [bacterium]